ncbi:MAG: NAD-dependent epimerase/dehydratase family protein [Cryomorphaceae bacterium]
MKVIITGATGMVGRGVLLECLEDLRVEKVLIITRRPSGESHPKLAEIIHTDFTEYTTIKDQLTGYDACFAIMGVSAAGMNEETYTQLTYHATVSLARTLFEANPNMTFTYVSGKGTDSTERGRLMWARVKGKTENEILRMGFQKALMFRPGLILPLRGITSSTRLYQFFFDYFMWLIRLVQWISPNSVTDTTRMGQAMINAHLLHSERDVLDPIDINLLAAKT